MRWSRRPTGLSHPRYATRSPILGRRFKPRRSRVETGSETRASSTVQVKNPIRPNWADASSLAGKHAVSLAKTSSDSLRSTEIRHCVHRPKNASLVGGKATGHTGVAMEGGKRAGWAAELDL